MLTPLAVALAAAIGLGAPPPAGAAAPAPDPAGAPPLERALADALAADIGKGGPVALLGGPAGLVALSPDGARREVVVAEPLAWAWPDARAQVVWVQTAADPSRLGLVDLTAATARVEPVLQGLPADAAPELLVRHPGREEVGSASDQAARLILSLEPGGPKLTHDAGLLVNWEDQERAFAKAIKQVRFAKGAKARLKALAKRGAARHVAPALPAAAARPARVGVPAAACEDAARCGQAEALPGTPWWLVTVGFSCGDGCYTERQLYDPKRGLFFDPQRPAVAPSAKPLPAASLADLRVSPDGAAYVSAGKVVRFAGGVVAVGTAGGGWLGGGWRVR